MDLSKADSFAEGLTDRRSRATPGPVGESSRHLLTHPPLVVGEGVLRHPGTEHWESLKAQVAMILIFLAVEVLRVVTTRFVWITTSRSTAQRSLAEVAFPGLLPFWFGQASSSSVPPDVGSFALGPEYIRCGLIRHDLSRLF
jgi:hypothetical protein